MEEPSNGVQSPTAERPTPVVQVGRLKLKGIPAVLALLAVLSAVVALTIYSRPRPAVLVSAGIWLLLDVYWSLAEVKRRSAKTAESPQSRRTHGLLTTAALLLLFIPIPGLTGQFVPDTLATAAIGLGIQIGFVLFYFWGRWHMGRLWSGAIRIMTDHQIVQSGPYRFLRHPMYTGMLGMCVGTAVVSGQYHALIGLALMTLAYARKIRMEERVLRDEFGDAYETYRRRTSALLPWIV
jgi:protein-S-isoprenylcysteine O-methyltransferase Ste14